MYSCKKNSSSNNSQTNSQLASIHIYIPVTTNATTDTFVYDANQRLVRFGFNNIDTAGGLSYPDTGSYYFTYNGSSSLASSFHFLRSQTINAGQPPIPEDQTDNLFYDSQNRLIKDTLAANQIPANVPDSGVWYLYSGSTIAVITGDNKNSIDILDSFYLTNGSITRWAEYDPVQAGVGSVDTSILAFSFSSYANPAYNSAIALTTGIFLLENTGLDAVSKNLPTAAKFNTDSQGRVTSTIGTDGTVTTYTYNK
jgi:hypothetical protein